MPPKDIDHVTYRRGVILRPLSRGLPICAVRSASSAQKFMAEHLIRIVWMNPSKSVFILTSAIRIGLRQVVFYPLIFSVSICIE